MTATDSAVLGTGQVWWAALGPTRGREQQGFRAVVVVAAEEYLDIVDTLTIVVPVTTVDRGWSNHVRLTGRLLLPLPSWAMTEQPNTIARSRLIRPAGQVDDACLESIRVFLGDYLGI